MNDCKWSVYIHTNKINGKKYVGITSQEPSKRWLNGFGYESHLPIGRAIRRYGWDNFDHDIVVSNVCEKYAKELEIYLISKLHTQDRTHGYNITNGGDGVTGFHHTDEAKHKMSVAKLGNNHPNYGKHLSDSTKGKIASKLIGNNNPAGHKRSKETRSKMSLAKQKPVSMIKDGIVIKTFESAKIAELITGINRKNISMCCKDVRKHAGGYEWKFA